VRGAGNTGGPASQARKPAKKTRTADERIAIDVAPSLWRTAHKNAGVKARLGGAYEDGICRYLKRADGGWEKLREALDHMVKEFPRDMYELSQENKKPWFNLEWFVRMEDSKGNPVNRPGDVLEGNWSSKDHTTNPTPDCKLCLCTPCVCRVEYDEKGNVIGKKDHAHHGV